MDVGMMAVAERLALEFPDLPNSTVIRVLTDCADEFPNEDALFLEHAVRARLALAQKVVGQVEEIPDQEAIARSLHDGERGEEVELTALLIVTANESSARLTQEQIDRVLGLRS